MRCFGSNASKWVPGNQLQSRFRVLTGKILNNLRVKTEFNRPCPKVRRESFKIDFRAASATLWQSLRIRRLFFRSAIRVGAARKTNMRVSAKQFERSATPENPRLTQSVCRFCRRIVGATARRKLLLKVEQTHICPEKPDTPTRKPKPLPV